jgi:hypothetical protein
VKSWKNSKQSLSVLNSTSLNICRTTFRRPCPALRVKTQSSYLATTFKPLPRQQIRSRKYFPRCTASLISLSLHLLVSPPCKLMSIAPGRKVWPDSW